MAYKNQILFGVIGFFLGISSLWAFNNWKDLRASSQAPIGRPEMRLPSSDTTGLTNPLLDCKQEEVILAPRTALLKEQIEMYIEKSELLKNVEQISVYFRELNFGTSFDINGDIPYISASLLKTPVMISYLSALEKNRDLINLRLKFNKEEVEKLPIQQNFVSADPIDYNRGYSIPELIERMIIHSDNAAMTLLVQQNLVDPMAILNDMGVRPTQDGKELLLTVKDYSTIFRVLYNSTYLSRQNSIWALDKLTKVPFDKGLVAGVPSGTLVAHKFGERKRGEITQIHDCGVIYYPSNPYLLCIMTRGHNFQRQLDVISEISRQIYDSRAARPKAGAGFGNNAVGN